MLMIARVCAVSNIILLARFSEPGLVFFDQLSMQLCGRPSAAQ